MDINEREQLLTEITEMNESDYKISEVLQSMKEANEIIDFFSSGSDVEKIVGDVDTFLYTFCRVIEETNEQR